MTDIAYTFKTSPDHIGCNGENCGEASLSEFPDLPHYGGLLLTDRAPITHCDENTVCHYSAHKSGLSVAMASSTNTISMYAKFIVQVAGAAPKH